MALQPLPLDILRLPEDFGTGRLENLMVTFDNLSSSFQYALQDMPFPVKNNSFFSFTIVEGCIKLLINLDEVELHSGQSMVIMPGCIFQSRGVSENLRFCGVMIDNEYMETMRKSVGLHVDLTKRYYNYMIHDLVPTVMDNHLQMYRMITRELCRENYTYKKEIIQRYCEIWVLKNISLSEHTARKPELARSMNRREQIFRDFLTLLEKYYTEERSISFYANQMCLTPKYLSTIIKEVSGKHGMQWIDDYVCLEAKALLRDGSLSVKQVSDQLHFPSQSMFGRFFKKMTGYSPKQYKQL